MTYRSSLAPLLLAALFSVPTLADAHAWEINEIFSNADGSVQFIEFTNQDDDEEILSEESLTFAGVIFNFPTNLPSSATANRTFLVATAGFAAIPGAPTPDYIMPTGYISAAGGILDYSGGDTVLFGTLPQDGKSSITRTGFALTNSPRNFAGASGSVRLAVSGERNGFGLNRLCYSTTAPVLGTVWMGTITGAGPSANIVAILGYEAPTTGPVLAGGQLLVSLASAQIFVLAQVSNGNVHTLSQVVPNDLSLIEFALSTQAVILGGGTFEFCNAVDLILGH